MITETLFASQNELFQQLGADCTRRLEAAVQQKNEASFLVSGGSTPKPLYQNLSQQDLAWHKIKIGLVDERWVEPNHSASNQAFIETHLLTGAAEHAQLSPMKTDHASAQQGLQQTEKLYQRLPLPAAVTVLGMGNDGHFASLFPGAKGCEQGLDLANTNRCVSILAKTTAVTGDHTERLSMTLAALLQSQFLVLLITGDKKREVYQAAKSNTNLPVAHLLQQQIKTVQVYWAP